MGDAVNWEWIVRCAQDSGKHIIIVSRDSDYGVRFENESLLNDALVQEFRERVSRKRKIILTDKLIFAFKEASIAVTKKEEKEELKLIEEIIDNEKLREERRQYHMDRLSAKLSEILDDLGIKRIQKAE